jgi:hypothetical protein
LPRNACSSRRGHDGSRVKNRLTMTAAGKQNTAIADDRMS